MGYQAVVEWQGNTFVYNPSPAPANLMLDNTRPAPEFIPATEAEWLGGGQQWEYNHQGDDGLRWRLRVDWGGKQLNVSGNCGRFPGGRSFAEQANLPKGIARRYYSFAPGTEFDPFLTALKRLMKRPEYNGF